MEQKIRRTGIDRRNKQTDIKTNKRSNTERRTVIKDSKRIIDYMKKIPLFDGLTYDEYTKILNICTKKIIPQEHFLCNEGDESDELFILLKGQLKVTFHGGTLLAYITPLGLVGEMGVFTDTKRSASVIATNESTVLRMSKNELFEVFRNNCALGNRIFLNVINDCAKKLHEDNEIVDEMRKKRLTRTL